MFINSLVTTLAQSSSFWQQQTMMIGYGQVIASYPQATINPQWAPPKQNLKLSSVNARFRIGGSHGFQQNDCIGLAYPILFVWQPFKRRDIRASTGQGNSVKLQ
jgi:hypothetical protein